MNFLRSWVEVLSRIAKREVILYKTMADSSLNPISLSHILTVTWSTKKMQRHAEKQKLPVNVVLNISLVSEELSFHLFPFAKEAFSVCA